MSYWRAIGMGCIAGMRSMTAPALVSDRLCDGKSEGAARPKGALGLLCNRTVMSGLHTLAAGEMAADKTSWIPDRISPLGLLGRALSGALVGAALSEADHGDPAAGAALGSLAAVGASYGMYHLRKKLGKELRVPDALLGVMEDAAAVGLGRHILDSAVVASTPLPAEAPATAPLEPALVG